MVCLHNLLAKIQRSFVCIVAIVALQFTATTHAKSDEARQSTLFEDVRRAIENSDNDYAKRIFSRQPELLLAQNESGVSLVELAFVSFNDDLVSQTNFEIVYFLIERDFFRQSLDLSEHLDWALSALSFADDQIQAIDLSKDMVAHKSRKPFIKLLSKTFEYFPPELSLESEKSLLVVLRVCDANAFEAGDEKLVSRKLSEAIQEALVPLHRKAIEISAMAENLDSYCVERLMM